MVGSTGTLDPDGLIQRESDRSDLEWVTENLVSSVVNGELCVKNKQVLSVCLAHRKTDVNSFEWEATR